MADNGQARTRLHAMPFGSEILPDGVLFRLWAPGARRVDLILENPHQPACRQKMNSEHGGWYRCFSREAGPGSAYRFSIDADLLVPDPASRCQAEDVHGPSLVIDPRAFSWQDGSWRGRPWEEAIIYELHLGTFSPQGGFSGVVERLDYLVELGITALELMPVADFPGKRNWGYDGTLLFAPDRSYGRPEELKTLVQAAHARNLMVFLDVVYNHFGPEGNYLHVYAREEFFTDKRRTPWGAALNFFGEGSALVRRFFVDNVLYWLEEYHFDGLRFDAVHAIHDDSHPDILEEIADAVRNGPGRRRHIHLILENDQNQVGYLRRSAGGLCREFSAQLNDDFHHACHVQLTGEHQGYYLDYQKNPLALVARCLTEGFAYQGEPSSFRGNVARGEGSGHLPLSAFVNFLQNHDQIGNRAFGERLGHLVSEPALRLAVALLLLAPSPPLLFMGEEYAAATPFCYFCDFCPELAEQVAEGRRREFADFFPPQHQQIIPDPNALESFTSSCLNWQEAAGEKGRSWLQLYRELLYLRRQIIVPRLAGLQGGNAWSCTIGAAGLHVRWILGDGALLEVFANFSDQPLSGLLMGHEALLYALPALGAKEVLGQKLAGWGIAWFLREKQGEGDGKD
jgi:maltooligosyltrehalose trehalohydrolase